MEAHLFGRLTPLREARRLLWEAVSPVERTESVPLELAFGRVAARTVLAPHPVPPFRRANWDGYAVRTRDLARARTDAPCSLRIVGEVFAEGGYRGRVGPGEAVAIATGGAMPAGADGLEIFERSARNGLRVTFRSPIRAGERIAPIGHDLHRGQRLIEAGDVLSPAALGALAACGIPRVSVYARPVVTIVPNGNELRPAGRPLRAGEIYESNNAALAAVVRACGAEPRPMPPTADRPEAIERALRQALRHSDLVLATGGSSVGERDHLPRIFPKLGKLLFHGIAVRPGKPTLAARSGSRLLVGLPGHPTSCVLNMYWLVLPALRRLARLPGPGWSVRTLRLAGRATALSPELATVVPLRVRGGSVRSTFRGSSAIDSLTGAGGFTILPPGRRSLPAGTPLSVCVLDPPLGPVASG